MCTPSNTKALQEGQRLNSVDRSPLPLQLLARGALPTVDLDPLPSGPGGHVNRPPVLLTFCPSPVSSSTLWSSKARTGHPVRLHCQHCLYLRVWITVVWKGFCPLPDFLFFCMFVTLKCLRSSNKFKYKTKITQNAVIKLRFLLLRDKKNPNLHRPVWKSICPIQRDNWLGHP